MKSKQINVILYGSEDVMKFSYESKTSDTVWEYTDEFEGKHHDIKATVKESDYCNKKMLDILKAATDQDGRTIKGKLLNATDRYITPDQAIELGVADEIWDDF